MINASTFEKLKALNLSAMADKFQNQLNDSKAYNSLGFEERIGLLVDAEWNRRQANKLKNLIKQAIFSVSSACIEDIEYLPDRKLDKAQMLRFSTCQYINEGHHIILKGATGSGKTYIACALGNAACRKFKTVRYIRMPELLDELSLAKQDGSFRRVINSYCKTELLIIDEWLIRKLSTQERYDLLEIIEKRANSPKGSMILCTQYNDEEWYGRIDPEFDEGSPIAEAFLGYFREECEKPYKLKGTPKTNEVKRTSTCTSRFYHECSFLFFINESHILYEPIAALFPSSETPR